MMQMAVIGKEECTDEEYEAARTAGSLIAPDHAVLCCGGRGGVMEAASRGARVAGGTTVGILPDTGKGNHFLDVVIRTGMGFGRNVILIQSRTRWWLSGEGTAPSPRSGSPSGQGSRSSGTVPGR